MLRSRFCFCVLVAALTGVGCGSGAYTRSEQSSTATPGTPVTTPAIWMPKTGDLRFQGLTANSSSRLFLSTGIGGGLITGGGTNTYTAQTGTPLQLGSGVCGSLQCEYFFTVNDAAALPTSVRYTVQPLASAYTGKLDQAFSAGSIVFSLDFQPQLNTFASAEILPDPSSKPFRGVAIDVKDADLSATVQSLTARGSVVTAIGTRAPGTWTVISYSWDGDSSPAMKHRLLLATLATRPVPFSHSLRKATL